MAERRPYLSRIGEIDLSQFSRVAPKQPAFYQAPDLDFSGVAHVAGEINRGSKIRRQGGYMANATDGGELPEVYSQDPWKAQLDKLEMEALAGAGTQVGAPINTPPQNTPQSVVPQPVIPPAEAAEQESAVALAGGTSVPSRAEPTLPAESANRSKPAVIRTADAPVDYESRFKTKGQDAVFTSPEGLTASVDLTRGQRGVTPALAAGAYKGRDWDSYYKNTSGFQQEVDNSIEAESDDRYAKKIQQIEQSAALTDPRRTELKELQLQAEMARARSLAQDPFGVEVERQKWGIREGAIQGNLDRAEDLYKNTVAQATEELKAGRITEEGFDKMIDDAKLDRERAYERYHSKGNWDVRQNAPTFR